MKLKDTLYTPKTDFQMRANAKTNEPLVIESLINENFYKNILESNKKNDSYYIHFGPPYANGSLHVGHGLNILLKDFCHRIALQKGLYAPMIVGWDTHGLPIEHAILKKKKASLSDTMKDFRTKCRTYALEQVNVQKKEMQRLGILSDLEEHYLTMDKEYEANQIELFFILMEKGFIYRSNKPIIWSWSSRSALAEAEVVYKDIESDSIYVLMKIAPNIFTSETFVLTWTTTPWTLPSNKAISFSSRYEYVICKDKSNRRILLGKKPFLRLKDKFELTFVENVSKDILNKIKYISPLTNEECPFLESLHVEMDQGSGLVHTAPAHGKDDYLVGKKNNIEVVSGVDEKGHLLHPKYSDVFYKKANKLIIEDLENMNLLLWKEKYKHSYPTDWRTGKEIIYMATTQWFINVSKVKKNILSILQDVKFYQPWAKQRIISMFENRDDWCISRQRRWGVPIAIYYDKEEKPILNILLFKTIKEIFSEEGSDSYYEKDFELKIIEKEPSLEKVLKTAIRKEEDIMDVWLDSGVSHYSVMYKNFNVTKSNLYFEGIDQFRGWFNSSLVTSVMNNLSSPYEAISTHGFIVDGNGNKMSKSKGNGMDFNEIIRDYGIEVYRLFVATVDYTDNAKLSKEILKQVSEQYKKIRNVFRFLLANLNGFDESNFATNFRPIDIYIIHKLNDLIETVEINFEKINFTNAIREINSFLVNEVSSLYFDISKDTLYVKEKTNLRRRQILTVFSFILDRVARLLWPILPILVDDVLKHSPISKINKVDATKQPEIIKLPPNYIKVVKKIEQLLIVRKSFLHSADELIKKNECKKTSEITCTLKSGSLFDFFSIEEIEEIFQCAKVVDKLSPKENDEVSIALEVDKNLIKCNRCWRFYDSKNITTSTREDETISICKECIKVLKKDFPNWK